MSFFWRCACGYEARGDNYATVTADYDAHVRGHTVGGSATFGARTAEPDTEPEEAA